MRLQEFSINTWATLKSPDASSGGYPSITLTLSAADCVNIHLFRDRSGHYHLAIEAPDIQPKHLDDPGVNGLRIQLVNYRFHDGPTSSFIDLTCSISGYLEEFTEVVREIASEILERNIAPMTAVDNVIRNWLTFWGKASKDVLSETDQIGLICELLVLEKLCEKNPEKALHSWKGPLGEKHDFAFSSWSLEVKGTCQSSRTHTINGIEQLMPPHKKQLGFISFQISKTNEISGLNLPNLIVSIRNNHFTYRPDLTLRFQELLLGAGYNPVHAQLYMQFRFDLIKGFFHIVDEGFPTLTSNMLIEPLDSHVSKIRYDISLEGIAGQNLEEFSFGELFINQ